MVRISVVICTFHRPQYLKKVLTSLSCQTLEKTDYEIIVIDSGSSDETRGIVNSSCGDIRKTVIQLGDTGLSDARNTGIRNSTGRIIAFLDDDALADPDWLEQILSVFDDGGTRVCACGGKLDLLWEQERPGWIHDRMLTYLGRFDLGVAGCPVPGLIGVNMAFDRRVFDRIGFFDTDLGRIEGNLLSGDEVDFFSRMRRNSLMIWYHPKIHVLHHVPPERNTKGFFYQRYYWQGRSDAIQNKKEKSCTAVFIRMGSFLVYFPFFQTGQWQEYVRCIHQYYKGYMHRFFSRPSPRSSLE
jgi:glucosyl-dolichyl phosphate glucuronosyltransferase